MSSHLRFATVVVVGLLAAPRALADKGTSTAYVLGQLHAANVNEMRMGTMARQRGSSERVRAFGSTLVDDHDAADAQVVALAKEEKIVLAASTPPVTLSDLPAGIPF